MDEHATNFWKFLILMFFIIVIAIFFYVKSITKHKQIILRLKEEYDQALRSGNKADALTAGRQYYSALRGGNLSIYDEQAISNDLATMK